MAALALVRLEVPLGRGLYALSDLAFVLLMAAALAAGRLRRPPLGLALAVAAPLLATLLAGFASSGEGVQAAKRLALPLAVLLGTACLRLDEEHGRWLERAWTAVAVAACVVGIAAFLHVVAFGAAPGALAQPNSKNLGEAVVRISGLMPTNALSSYLVASVAFALALCRRSPQAPAPRLALFVLAATCLLSLSRGVVGLAWMLAGVARNPALAPPWLPRHRRLLQAGAALLTAAAVVATLWGIFPVRWEADGVHLNWSPNAYRLLHTAGLRMFAAHLLLGVGPGLFPREFVRFTTPAERAGAWPPFEDGLRYPPHSIWIGAAAECGLVGLLGWIVLLLALRRGLSGPEEAPLSGLLGWAAVGLLLNALVADLADQRALWAALGFGLAASRPRPALRR